MRRIITMWYISRNNEGDPPQPDSISIIWSEPMPDQFQPPEGINWEAIDEKEFYRFMYTYYFHQDVMAWKRTELIFAVEAGVLAAAFSQRAPVAVLALMGGSIIVFLIWRLIQRDEQVRDQYNRYFKNFQAKFIKDPAMPDRIMAVPAKTRWHRGGYIAQVIVWSLIIFNLVCVSGFLWRSYCTYRWGIR